VPTDIFPIRSRRFERAKRVQTLQHVAAAFLLITAALAHLTDKSSHHVVLPVLELIAGITLIGAAIHDRFRKTHSRVGWVELAGSAMTFVEAIAKLAQPHKILFHVLTFIPPVILLFFGLFEERLRRQPGIRVDDEGFEVRQGLLFRRRVRFEGLSGYRITPTHVELMHEDGRTTRLRTTGILNRDEAMEWLAGQFERRGLSQ
jgi:hypothetical protein